MKLKHFLFFALSMTSIISFSNTSYDVRENGCSYVYVDSLKVSPDVAYSNVQEWILVNSSNYKSSMQYENKEQGKLIAKSGIVLPVDEKYGNVESISLCFDLTIDLKINKYRIKIDNIVKRMVSHSIFDFDDKNISETPIDEIACYEKDPITNEYIFTQEDKVIEYNNKILELRREKDLTKKKDKIKELDREIDKYNTWLEWLEQDRYRYVIINQAMEIYLSALINQINKSDDF